MDDRVAEIREALANPGRFAMAPAVIWKAAKEWADLLNSGALIIRRDENGWDATAVGQVTARLRQYDMRPGWAEESAIQLLDALASSQGVEP